MSQKRILFTPPRVGVRSNSAGDLVGGGMIGSAPTTIAALYDDLEGTSPNSGNIIHGEAAIKTFAFDPGRSCIGYFPDASKATLEQGVAEVERRFDAVIASFSNIIRTRVPEERMEKEGAKLDIVSDYLERLKIPVYVLGIGIQDVPEPDKVWAPLRRLLLAADKHARLFGVRGLTTEKWLRSIGCTKAVAIGCPSLFAFPANVMRIAPPQIGPGMRVGTAGHIGAAPRKRASVTMLQRIAGETTADYVFQNDLFPLTGGDKARPGSYDDATASVDRSFIEPLIRRSAKWDGALFRGYYFFREPGRWRTYAHDRDLYYGDRFHGGVAFLQAGRPALIAGKDARVSELASFFDLPHIGVDEAAQIPVADAVADRLGKASLDRFKTTYVRRLADYVRACEAAGLEFQNRAEIAGGLNG